MKLQRPSAGCRKLCESIVQATACAGWKQTTFHRQNRSVLAQGAGYSVLRKGVVALKKTEFFHALAAAKGVHIAPNRIEKPKAPPSFRVKASKRGVLPIAQCYSSLINIGPNEMAKIETEGEGDETVLIISRLATDSVEEDTAPVSCGI